MTNELKNVMLSFCCDKEWSHMRSVDEQRKFCETCQHNVIDFTKATQQQFTAAMQGSARVCGRFKPSQMNESFIKYAASLVVASSVTLSCSPVAEPVDPKATEPLIEIELPQQELEEDFGLMGIVIYDPADTIKIETPLPDGGEDNP